MGDDPTFEQILSWSQKDPHGCDCKSCRYRKEVARLLLSLRDERDAARKWISVNERLPKEQGLYLCWKLNPLLSGPVVDYWNGYTWLDYEPSHWMPLPPPPERNEGRE